MKWTKIENGLPKEHKPFVVFCPTISKDPTECIKTGMLTTHNRGIGIRPEGEKYYHFHNDTTHWKYISFPIHSPDPHKKKTYKSCLCFQCSLLNKFNVSTDCACDSVPVYSKESCGNCPKKFFCDVSLNPKNYDEEDIFL